ncbi:MAG: nuclear transport factor 2 family protein [Planctomycetota bacterium]|nr:nuclear transport factor 2 family protein [Planctomycetota bacterium]
MKIVLLLSLLALAACQSATKENMSQETSPSTSSDGLTVDQVVDDWHQAASDVDADRYLGYLAEESVFLGTDPGERWDKTQFSAYVEHYFKDLNRGWTYRPSQRMVSFGPDGKTAWFDELLDHDRYGVLRGTGVLQRKATGWRIVHYSMTFAVPNGLVDGLRQLLDQAEETASEEGVEPAE